MQRRDLYFATLGSWLLALILSSAVTADTETVEIKPDGSRVSLTGTVVSKTFNSFILDYGEGTITIEVDDWDFEAEDTALRENDKVTVYGRVDDDFYQLRTIEAETIFIEDGNTVVTAPSSRDDEEPEPSPFEYFAEPTEYDFQVAGIVTSRDGRQFTIDTGSRQITVDTIFMQYNPLDDKGFQQVDVGDYVQVNGQLSTNVFEKREVMADSIISFG